jgi:hypothetical protein
MEAGLIKRFKGKVRPHAKEVGAANSWSVGAPWTMRLPDPISPSESFGHS